jgi:hypothetical protein
LERLPWVLLRGTQSISNSGRGAPRVQANVAHRARTGLVDGGFALSESSAIVDYLEERYAARAFLRILPTARLEVGEASEQ